MGIGLNTDLKAVDCLAEQRDVRFFLRLKMFHNTIFIAACAQCLVRIHFIRHNKANVSRKAMEAAETTGDWDQPSSSNFEHNYTCSYIEQISSVVDYQCVGLSTVRTLGISRIRRVEKVVNGSHIGGVGLGHVGGSHINSEARTKRNRSMQKYPESDESIKNYGDTPSDWKC